jgi:UDP-4-amino-4,6-dideoxy-N-acetyl-beta-L-altrosamine transaminase
MIPYGKQDISQDDIDQVVNVLKSDFLTQGPKVPEFERVLALYSGAKYAVVTNSATSALHLACLALGLGENDILWTSPITFVASANAGLYCGAKVDFVDIDSSTYNICPIKLEEKLVEAKRFGSLPKVLVPVHLTGQPCDMSAIHRLCTSYGVKIIEDASHAIGGAYKGAVIGSCAYSDVTIFSFHPVKIVTTAEGGAVTTNNDDIAKRISLLRSHGITRDPSMMCEDPHGPWYYEQISLGFNYRMTELQAALGISQMERIDEFVRKRHAIADRYNKLLENFPVKVPYHLENTYSAMHLYVIRLNLDEIVKTHRQVFEELRENGIGVNLHYIPVHMQPYYKAMGFNLGDFIEAENYYREAISLPMYPTLSLVEQSKVVDVLSNILGLN